ncbi:Nif3-like dinuclear metal center hexameric protein [Candidatus Aerophobetes bacterium]|nr:Nif3-like dinuclear metal center hexameric protein [Candidatus Aerophobetes bacterium]
MPKVKDVIYIIEKIAPPYLALPEDKIGLQVGEENAVVDAVLLCLDITEETVQEAKQKGANLIVAHHPLIYHPLTRIDFAEWPSNLIREAVKNDISIYIAHTNLDVAPGGVNDALLKTLENELKIKKKGALSIFKGNREFYLGKIGYLEKGKSLEEIALSVKKALKAKNIKVGGAKNNRINKIALCGGSCRELLPFLFEKDVQLFITGELGYHSLIEAKYSGLSVIEAGHYETEVVVLPFLKEKMKKEFKQRGWEEKIFESKIYTSPYFNF